MFKLNLSFKLTKHTTLQATREGKRFLIATGVLLFAALNTGNNLMYLIFSMMLALLALSMVVPLVNLKGIHCSMDVKEPVFANSAGTVTIGISNSKVISSFSLRLQLEFIEESPFYIKKVPAKSMVTLSEDVVFHRRGIYDIKQIKLTTAFPFVFFIFSRDLPLRKKVIVYPRVLDIDVSEFRDSLISSARAALKVPTGEYPHSLRQYTVGDPLRYIHWKATAKLGSFMVKEFYREQTERITLVLDNSSADFQDDLFEKTVSLAATVLLELAETTMPFRLITCDKAFPFGTGRAHLWLQLDYLAGITPVPRAECNLTEDLEEQVILVAPHRGGPAEGQIETITRAFYASSI